MGTDDEAMYEGCFVIPSAKKDPDGIGHPFEYHLVLQVQSSEIAGAAVSGIDWEKVTVIAKIPMAGGALEQRQPTIREMRWLKDQFWEDHETIAMFMGSREAHLAIDHRIMHWFRPADGWNTLPELFRELVPVIDEETGADLGQPLTVVDIVRERRAAAHSRERQQGLDAQARRLDDIRKILDGALYVGPRDDAQVAEREGHYRLGEGTMARLRELLGIG